MRKAIVIDYQPFAITSKAYIFNGGQVDCIPIASEIEEMADGLVYLCYSKEIFDIKIDAPVDILNNLENKVLLTEQNNYSQNKITVEGMQMQ